MARFGNNLKLTVDRAHRPALGAAFEALGAQVVQSPRPDLELYKLDGFQIGAFYVEAKDALSIEDQRKGAWLEILVADVDGMVKRLVALGLTKIDYADSSHTYFQLPGGPVFRLAAASGP